MCHLDILSICKIQLPYSNIPYTPSICTIQMRLPYTLSFLYPLIVLNEIVYLCYGRFLNCSCVIHPLVACPYSTLSRLLKMVIITLHLKFGKILSITVIAALLHFYLLHSKQVYGKHFFGEATLGDVR